MKLRASLFLIKNNQMKVTRLNQKEENSEYFTE